MTTVTNLLWFFEKDMQNNENKKSWLLNWAENRLYDFSNRLGQPQVLDEIHILNSEELNHLKRIEKAAVLRAGIAGAISAFFCSVFGIFSYYYLEIDPNQNISWNDFFRFWILLGPVILFFTLLEFYYLYYDGLKSIAQIAFYAGLDLTQDKPYISPLAEAALEIQNKNQELLGINPLKKSSKPKLFFSESLYKAKIIITNLLLKFIVSRIVGRVAVRGIFDLIAIPVTAFWDAWICYNILKEARLRAIGPSAIQERIQTYFPNPENLSEEFKAQVLRSVAYTIVSTENLHPNLAYLVVQLHEKLKPQNLEFPINEELLFQNSHQLQKNELLIVAKIMAFAIIIDGKITSKEKNIFNKFVSNAKIPVHLEGLDLELQKIYQGKSFSVSSIFVEPMPINSTTL